MFGDGYVIEDDDEDNGNFTFGEQNLQYDEIRPSDTEETGPTLQDSEDFKRNVVADIEGAFKSFDINGDGKLTIHEIVSGMLSVGKEISPEEVHEIIEEIDQDGDGELNFEEFKEHLYERMLNGTVEEDLWEAFNVFDIDGDGFISPLELQMMFHKLGEMITKDDALDLMLDADVDSDGLISFEEFRYFYSRMDPFYKKDDTYVPPKKEEETNISSEKEAEQQTAILDVNSASHFIKTPVQSRKLSAFSKATPIPGKTSPTISQR